MQSGKQHFLMLLSLSKANAALGKKVLDAIKAKVDPGASPLWIDAHGVGLFIETDLPAWKIWQTAGPQAGLEDWMAMKDFLILQVGPGWYARDNTAKAAAWMHARYPRPTN